MKRLIYTAVLAAGLASCGTGGDNEAEEAKAVVTADLLRAHAAYLSSDECDGRKPFSAGAERAVEYLEQQMKEIGLTPIGTDGSYRQDVPLVLAAVTCDDTMRITTPQGDMSLRYLEDYTGFTKLIEPEVSIDNAELVFAGYGIVAPEYGKDDYRGLENPENKVAVVFVNDPGLGTEGTYFTGDTMTYYGRWMYKLEEGARQRLKGVLIVHDERGAGYPWSVVTAGARSKLYIDDKADTSYRCPLEGWITEAQARELLRRNGYDFDDVKERSKRPDFKPFALNSTVSTRLHNTFTYNTSPNVAGYIQGSKDNGENIVCIAHWDHLGHGKPVDGDSIINGATDNATAMAWLLGTARAFTSLKRQPERSIVFLCPTSEETGFQGTKYYVSHPIFPVDKTVAVLNLDVIPLWGENNDLTITGYGQSTLDDMMARLAEKYGRYIMPDPDAFNGMFYRSDHFAFVQQGVPAMFAKGWNDNRKHGREWSAAKIKDYWANTYHKPTDELHPDTDDYGGLLQEFQIYFDLAYELTHTDIVPQWKEGSSFGRR